MAPELRVELLGPVRAWSGEREVALGSSRPRAVFAMLATRQNSVVSRTELIDGVWGDDPPATAAGSLHTYISTLRKALEPERARRVAPRLLTSVGAGYRLRVDDERVDAAEFTRLRGQARRQFAGGDAHGALRVLDDALALWRGEALSGVGGPFADTERTRLGELRTATQELRAEVGLAAGRHADLVAELTALVHEHPLRERPRELLMLALHRCGRNAEALATYREARQVLVDELGIEPSPALRRLHDQVLAGEDPQPAVRRPAQVTITRVAPTLVGRVRELAVVDTLLAGVATGRGRCLWVEGEMGIGKSALVAAALARAESAGHQIAHAAANELAQRFPLRLALDSLDVHADATDPRRAAVAKAMRDDRPAQSILAGGDPLIGAVDTVVTLVRTLCADGPLVLALDDLHWADEASMLVWHRLCTETTRLPLLLIGATRPVPQRSEIDRLRRAVIATGGAKVDLVPLTETDTAHLVRDLVGAPPGPRLRAVTARAGGNPLYLREITDALMRDQVVAIGTNGAEVPRDWVDKAPESLVSAVTSRLGYLSETTLDVLRSAALLCGPFAVGDLAILLDKPVSALVRPFDEAIAAGVLQDAGNRLAFRHPVIWQALYDDMAVAVRDALHHQAAETLASAGSPVDHVANQLLAAGGEFGRWVTEWLVAATPVLTYRAPLVAVELLQRVLRSGVGDEVLDATLRARLANVLFRIGRDAEAQENARRALPVLRDPHLIAQVRWVLSYVPYRASRADESVMALADALADPVLPDVWRARLTSQLALVQRAGVGELEVAAKTARKAIELGELAGDRFTIGLALEVLWQVDAVRRDYASSVGYLDQALEVVGTDLSLVDLRLLLLDNRVFTLQCLDRLDDATADLELALRIAGHTHPVAGVHLSAAVHYFWLGRWDDAQARIDAVLNVPEFTGFGLREGGGPDVLMHGVAALIAAHRDDTARLETHLEAGLNLPQITAADRENCDFLLAAQAMAEWRQGNAAAAIAVLGTILDTKHALMMLRHQWLPDLVRLALDHGDLDTARAAVAVCEREAAQETTPARAAAAAQRCRSLLEGDPDGLLPVIDHYETAGRTYELAQTLEDHAVLLHRAGRPSAASHARAVALHRSIGAQLDVRRIGQYFPLGT
jgi:DNA-binding SARP family transcriptional activator/tetratricopeptide (TPR) repeat protein